MKIDAIAEGASAAKDGECAFAEADLPGREGHRDGAALWRVECADTGLRDEGVVCTADAIGGDGNGRDGRGDAGGEGERDGGRGGADGDGAEVYGAAGLERLGRDEAGACEKHAQEHGEECGSDGRGAAHAACAQRSAQVEHIDFGAHRHDHWPPPAPLRVLQIADAGSRCARLLLRGENSCGNGHLKMDINV